MGAADDAGISVADDELHRNTLPRDCQKEEVELGMEAGLRELERSVSTAALTRYAIAVGIHRGVSGSWIIGNKGTGQRGNERSVVCRML